MADDCGAFVSPVSLLLIEGGKNSSTLCFDLTLEQLHTDRERWRARWNDGKLRREREQESRGGTDGELGVCNNNNNNY